MAALGGFLLQRFSSPLKTSSFEVVYSRPPPSIRSYEPGDARLPAVDKAMQDRDVFLAEVRDRLEQAQQHYKAIYYRKHRPFKCPEALDGAEKISTVWDPLSPQAHKSFSNVSSFYHSDTRDHKHLPVQAATAWPPEPRAPPCTTWGLRRAQGSSQRTGMLTAELVGDIGGCSVVILARAGASLLSMQEPAGHGARR
jgi:hypothetical protein